MPNHKFAYLLLTLTCVLCREANATNAMNIMPNIVKRLRTRTRGTGSSAYQVVNDNKEQTSPSQASSARKMTQASFYPSSKPSLSIQYLSSNKY